MGNIEVIYMGNEGNNIEFRVFRRCPIPIARKIEKLLIEMAADTTGTLRDMESGEMRIENMKGINLDLLHEIYDILLTETVLSPIIKKDFIEDINHEFQEYFGDLTEILFDKYCGDKKKEKKKPMK